MNLSPDGPAIVSLDGDAASVIVGNPAHVTVTMDNPRTMILNAGIPGMTRVTVLSSDGRVIFNEKVIANGVSDGYIRVRNACINGGDGCHPTTMFYCEEGVACQNILVNEPAVDGGGGGASSGGSSDGQQQAAGAGEMMTEGMEF